MLKQIQVDLQEPAATVSTVFYIQNESAWGPRKMIQEALTLFRSEGDHQDILELNLQPSIRELGLKCRSWLPRQDNDLKHY